MLSKVLELFNNKKSLTPKLVEVKENNRFKGTSMIEILITPTRRHPYVIETETNWYNTQQNMYMFGSNLQIWRN